MHTITITGEQAATLRRALDSFLTEQGYRWQVASPADRLSIDKSVAQADELVDMFRELIYRKA